MANNTKKPAGAKAKRFVPKIPAHVLLRILAGASVALMLGLLLHSTWSYLTHRPEFMVHPDRFQLDTPAWATDELSKDVCGAKGLDRAYSIFERGMTHKIARAFESSPWVRQVQSIKREFPNKIQMQLALRRPVAVIRVDGKQYLADDQAVRLPREYYHWPHSAIPMPMIFRDKLREIPEPGDPWRDRGVRAGVMLAQFLSKNQVLEKLRITAIEASGVCRRRLGGDSCLCLLTEDHTRILWGCSTLCESPGELSDEEKLANLMSVAEKENYDFSRLEYVDVRWERPAARRRPAAPVN